MTILDRTLGASSVMLQCEVTTVRGINSTLDIVWYNGAEELNRISPMIVNNVNVYMETYTIAQNVTTELNGSVYSCEAVINSDPVVRSIDNTTLDVIGEIWI